MKKVKVIPTATLAEISQSRPIKFAFVSEDNDTLVFHHPLVMCRDFLSDVWMTTFRGGNSSIYGFNYQESSGPIDKDKLRFLIYLPDYSYIKLINDNFPFLQEAIAPMGWESVELEKTNDPNYLYFKADGRWLSTPYTISLITFLIRLCAYDYSDGTKYLSADTKQIGLDIGYLKTRNANLGNKTLAEIIKIWLSNPIIPENYPKLPTHIVHNYGGVVNTFGGIAARSGNEDLHDYYKKLEAVFLNEMSKL